MNRALWLITIRALVVLLIILLAIGAFKLLAHPSYYNLFIWAIPFLPAVINLLFIYKLSSIFNLSQKVFFRKYLLYNGIKFLINLFLFVLVIFVCRSNPVPFIVVYLLSYFIFFVLEIIEIQILIRKI